MRKLFLSAISLRPEVAAALRVGARLSASVFLVGGCVRDALLGREVEDVDLCVAGDVPRFCAELARELGAKVIELHEEPLTLRIVRRDMPALDVVAVGRSLEENLRQRDFTINALALAPRGEQWEVVDPLGGLADIEAGILRMTSPAAFDADPLRLLRAFRLAAELGFVIEEKTLAAVAQRAQAIAKPAAERINAELTKLLASQRAAQALEGMRGVGLLFALVPELEPTVGQNGGGRHHLDVFSHSIETVHYLDLLLHNRQAEPDLGEATRKVLCVVAREPLHGVRSRPAAVKLGALVHDVAKPRAARPRPGGGLSFAGHAELGAEMAREICLRLRASRQETKLVATLVRHHLRPSMLAKEKELSARAIRRLLRDTAPFSADVLALALCDRLATRGGSEDEAQLARYKQAFERLAEACVKQGEEREAKPRLVTGRDIMEELGLAPGPVIGRLLEAVQEAQELGEIHSRAEALALARKLAAELSNGPR